MLGWLFEVELQVRGLGWSIELFWRLGRAQVLLPGSVVARLIEAMVTEAAPAGIEPLYRAFVYRPEPPGPVDLQALRAAMVYAIWALDDRPLIYFFAQEATEAPVLRQLADWPDVACDALERLRLLERRAPPAGGAGFEPRPPGAAGSAASPARRPAPW